MKKGIVRMIIGAIMIGFQIFSMLGSMKAGISIPSLSSVYTSSLYVSYELALYDLVYFMSYYSIGILGVILFLSGIYAYNK
jgi:hypothetical protein